MTLTTQATDAPGAVSLEPSDALLGQLEAVYKDIHANPQMSTQETRTAEIAAEWLKASGYEVTTGVGGTGVIGVLQNGDGPTVLLRADMDALPITETTGLAYKPSDRDRPLRPGDRDRPRLRARHACLSAYEGGSRPGGEQGSLEGRAHRPVPAGGGNGEGRRRDHQGRPRHTHSKAGHRAWATCHSRTGRNDPLAVGARDGDGRQWEVKLFGRGVHGSAPQKGIDPVVMASSAVLRLQAIVSREVGMTDSAVVTVGTLRAGMNENVIPDEALLRLNVRTFKQEVRKRVLAAIRRILEAETAASGSPKPPEFSVLSEFQAVVNDEKETGAVIAAFERRFGADRVIELPTPQPASEDFSAFGPALRAPSVYWFVGGVDPGIYAAAEKAGTLDELPFNHAPNFAPVIEPTLRTGVETLLTAAGLWLETETLETEDAKA